MTDSCARCDRELPLGEYRYADPPRLARISGATPRRYFALAATVRRDTILCGACVGGVYRQQRAEQHQESAACPE